MSDSMDQTTQLKVLVVEPQRKPYVKTIDNGLRSLQDAVGGYIEAIYPFEEDPVAIICDEEGKLNGKPLNRCLRDDRGNLTDVLAGTFLITGLGEEDFCSLSDPYIQKYSAFFAQPERFIRTAHGILVMPCEEAITKKPSIDKTIQSATNRTAGESTNHEPSKAPEPER